MFAKHETIAVGATDRKNPLDTAGQKTETKTTLYRMDMELAGANFTNRVRADGASSDYTNYYYAHCPDGVTHVRSYETLVYEEIYDNIDLVFYEKDGTLKYDFVLRPGAV